MPAVLSDPQPPSPAAELERWGAGVSRLTGGRYEVRRLIARGG